MTYNAKSPRKIRGLFLLNGAELISDSADGLTIYTNFPDSSNQRKFFFQVLFYSFLSKGQSGESTIDLCLNTLHSSS